MSKNKYHSDFLFSTPTFINGIGSIINIAGNYYIFNYSETAEEADAKAIEADWGVIGQDLLKASLGA
jgi:hypothetical protein